MTNEEKVQYWIELSDDDFTIAETMLCAKHYLYVGFMCHQVVEKIFKAGYAKLKEATPPFTHKLPYLAQMAGFYDSFSDEQKLFVQNLDPLNIEARYPEYKKELLKRLTPSICAEIIEQTKALQTWIKEKIL